MSFLCDTNVISEVLRPRPIKTVEDWLDSLEIVYVSVVTVGEIHAGLAYKKALKQTRMFEDYLDMYC